MYNVLYLNKKHQKTNPYNDRIRMHKEMVQKEISLCRFKWVHAQGTAILLHKGLLRNASGGM